MRHWIKDPQGEGSFPSAKGQGFHSHPHSWSYPTTRNRYGYWIWLGFPDGGMDKFWDITELGSRLLTLEFLCTLQYYEGGIAFRMFKQGIMLSWRELSNHLGFSSRFILDIDSDLPNFERHQFKREISWDEFYSQARTSDMEHPLLGCSTNGSGTIFSIAMILEKQE